MKNNTAFFLKADHERSRREWTVAVTASVILHIVLFILIAVFSGHTRSSVPIRVIDVDLSMTPPPKGKSEAPKAKAAPTKKKAVKKASKTVAKKKAVTGLKKKKTVKKTSKSVKKPEDTINDAIKRLEKNLANTPKPQKDPIADRLKQMEEETQRSAKDDEPVGTETGTAEKGDSAVEATLELRYIYNVGMEIRENWAFADKLAAGQENLETRVVFEVLPDGEIRGVRLTRRSGNDYMDSSATMAIVKSSPVRPFPPGLNKPFVEVRLRFTPKGLN